MSQINNVYSQYTNQELTPKQYYTKTFLTVALGLLITTITSVLLSYNYIGLRLAVQVPMLDWILIISQVVVVINFSRSLHKTSLSGAKKMFILYSILTGVSFSVLQYMFELETIALAFGVSCVYFGALATIGATTNFNLMRIRPVLMIGLFVLVVFNLLSMVFRFDGMTQISCSLGILLFSGITAYDVQKMKRMYEQSQGNPDLQHRVIMVSAFELYLDFINIFIYILRIIGNRD